MNNPKSLTVRTAAFNRNLASHKALLDSIAEHSDRSADSLKKEWDALKQAESTHTVEDGRPDKIKSFQHIQERKREIQRALAVLEECSDGCKVMRTDAQTFGWPEKKEEKSVNLSAAPEIRDHVQEFVDHHTAHHPEWPDIEPHLKPLSDDVASKATNSVYQAHVNGHHLFVKRAATYRKPDSHKESLVPKLAHLFGLQEHFTPVKEHVGSDGEPYISMNWHNGETMLSHLHKGHDHEVNQRVGKLGSDKVQKLALFDYLTGNEDRHPGNIMMGHDGRVHMIDHGMAFAANHSDFEDDHPLLEALDGHGVEPLFDHHNIGHMLQNSAAVKLYIKDHAKTPDEAASMTKVYNTKLAFLKHAHSVAEQTGPIHYKDMTDLSDQYAYDKHNARQNHGGDVRLALVNESSDVKLPDEVASSAPLSNANSSNPTGFTEHEGERFFVKVAGASGDSDHHLESLIPKLAEMLDLGEYFLPVTVHKPVEKDQDGRDHPLHRISTKALDGVAGDKVDDGEYDKLIASVPEDDKKKLVLFDLLMSKQDRHRGNIWFEDNGGVRLIDNGKSLAKPATGDEGVDASKSWKNAGSHLKHSLADYIKSEFSDHDFEPFIEKADEILSAAENALQGDPLGQERMDMLESRFKLLSDMANEKETRREPLLVDELIQRFHGV